MLIRKSKFKTGEIINDIEILKDLGKRCNNRMRYYLIRCIVCGYEKEIAHSQILSEMGTHHDSKHIKDIMGIPYPDYRRLYITYRNMVLRCTDPKNEKYKNYGGRGIKNEYKSFDHFLITMYKSYKEHAKKYGEHQTTLDRIDVDGNYSVKNCRWATHQIQAVNKRNNRLFKAVSPEGETFISNNQQAFARDHGLNAPDINRYLKGKYKTVTLKGWTFEYLDDK